MDDLDEHLIEALKYITLIEKSGKILFYKNLNCIPTREDNTSKKSVASSISSNTRGDK